jgi:hypothetical protein
MGRTLTTNGPSKLVQIKEKEGVTFTGVLLNMGKEVKMAQGKSMVFDFSVLDGDVNYVEKQENGKYVGVDVNEGERVAVFAPSLLARALAQAQVGEKVKITYLGLGKKTKGRNAPHTFDVKVID